MILQFSLLKDAPIYVDGKEVGCVRKVFMESEKGKVRGFFVAEQKAIILLEDLLSWNPLTVRSLQQFISVDSAGQVQEELLKLMQKPFQPVGLPVRTQAGTYLGKVRDYSFDTLNGLILQIFVEKKVLFFSKRRIIPRTAIIAMTAREITVKDDHAFERYSVKELFQPERKKVGASGVACSTSRR